jgi:mRNA-degrading endonuclease toxin of MazEF toxin-antitoxin module
MKDGRANLPGRHGGIHKLRLVAIIDDRKWFPPGSTVEVVVVTATNDDENGSYVELAWHPQGNASTKLRERSFANANWIEHPAVEELLTEVCGKVPLSVLEKNLDAMGGSESQQLGEAAACGIVRDCNPNRTRESSERRAWVHADRHELEGIAAFRPWTPIG